MECEQLMGWGGLVERIKCQLLEAAGDPAPGKADVVAALMELIRWRLKPLILIGPLNDTGGETETQSEEELSRSFGLLVADSGPRSLPTPWFPDC